jgi:hypothetical protein
MPRTARCGASGTTTACRPGGVSRALQGNGQNAARIRLRHRHLRYRRFAGWPVSDWRDLRRERQAEAGALSNRRLRKGGGDDPFETLYDFEYNSPGNFVYSPDGRYLYGSSYYTGASNLFRYDFETKKMDVISNAETGLFRPMPLADGSLIAFEYTSKGFMPARVPTKPLEDVSAVKYFGQATLNKYPELKQMEAAAAVLGQFGES